MSTTVLQTAQVRKFGVCLAWLVFEKALPDLYLNSTPWGHLQLIQASTEVPRGSHQSLPSSITTSWKEMIDCVGMEENALSRATKSGLLHA